jgi:hypothetical protein
MKSQTIEASEIHQRIYIKNWWKFQHYHDRRPSWIKLHTSILTDDVLINLPGDDFKHLVRLWLALAEHEGSFSQANWALGHSVGFSTRKQWQSFLARMINKSLITEEDSRGARAEVASDLVHRRRRDKKEIKNKENNPNTSSGNSNFSPDNFPIDLTVDEED